MILHDAKQGTPTGVWFTYPSLLKASLILSLHPNLPTAKRKNSDTSCEKKETKSEVTCCSIALNCCSIGLHSAEMTGSL